MGIRITAAEWGPRIAKQLSAVHQGALRAAMNAAEFGKAKSIHETGAQKVVDRGLFKNSWDAKPLPDGAEIRNACPYAAPLEVGSRPHHVPFQALLAWAIRKFGAENAARVAKGVQRKIARLGTKPRFIARGVLPAIQKEMKRECDRIVAEVARKG